MTAAKTKQKHFFIDLNPNLTEKEIEGMFAVFIKLNLIKINYQSHGKNTLQTLGP